VRADGRPGAVAGQTAINWWRHRKAAHEGYRKRLQALRAAGWCGSMSRITYRSPLLLVATRHALALQLRLGSSI
jgi:hypothetical protein